MNQYIPTVRDVVSAFVIVAFVFGFVMLMMSIATIGG